MGFGRPEKLEKSLVDLAANHANQAMSTGLDELGILGQSLVVSMYRVSYIDLSKIHVS